MEEIAWQWIISSFFIHRFREKDMYRSIKWVEETTKEYVTLKSRNKKWRKRKISNLTEEEEQLFKNNRSFILYNCLAFLFCFQRTQIWKRFASNEARIFIQIFIIDDGTIISFERSNQNRSIVFFSSNQWEFTWINGDCITVCW